MNAAEDSLEAPADAKAPLPPAGKEEERLRGLNAFVEVLVVEAAEEEGVVKAAVSGGTESCFAAAEAFFRDALRDCEGVYCSGWEVWAWRTDMARSCAPFAVSESSGNPSNTLRTGPCTLAAARDPPAPAALLFPP